MRCTRCDVYMHVIHAHIYELRVLSVERLAHAHISMHVCNLYFYVHIMHARARGNGTLSPVICAYRAARVVVVVVVVVV